MPTRLATAADADLVVGTLVDSHLDYVWEQWAVRGADRRDKLSRLVRHHVELVALPRREVWIHDEAPAVAIWREEPEAALDAAVGDRLRAVAVSVFGDRLPVIEAVDARLLEHRPPAPHRFLGTMGVHPDRQRLGFGTAVLQPVLEDLDRTGTPACLETSAAGNVQFYGSLGFTVSAHLTELPGDAPATWVMWREPAVSIRADSV